MRLRQFFKQRQTSRIALSHNQSGLHEGLPEVRVEQHMADRAFAEDVGDASVETNAFSGFPFVFRERSTGRSHESSVRWQHNTGVRRLPTELIDDIG